MNEHEKPKNSEEIKKEEKEPEVHHYKKKDFKLLITIIAIILVFVLIIIFAPGIAKLFHIGETNYAKYIYNGFTFQQVDGLWYTEIQPTGSNKLFQVPLHFGPKTLEDIPVTGTLDQRFYSNETYLTMDAVEELPKANALAIAELSLNLAQLFGITPVVACSGKLNATGCDEVPTINCQNTNQSVIYFEERDTTQVLFEGNCVRIQGKDMEMVRATDRFLLHWFGIMKPK